MAQEEPPTRPDTPPAEAIEALEMVLMTVFAISAQATGAPLEFAKQARATALEAFTRVPMTDPRRVHIADHMDWFLATQETFFRNRQD